MPKLFDTLASRYRDRPGGYTRLHKLPPRYGDMAPQAILELVDGKRDMLFSMTARNVARSAILGTKWLSEPTKNAIHRLLKSRGEEGLKSFEEEVQHQKEILLREDDIYETQQTSISERPLERIKDRVLHRKMQNTNPKNKKKRRLLEEEWEERKRRLAYVSEEDKNAEYSAALAKSKSEVVSRPEYLRGKAHDVVEQMEEVKKHR
jgi:hypothetical protein